MLVLPGFGTPAPTWRGVARHHLIDINAD